MTEDRVNHEPWPARVFVLMAGGALMAWTFYQLLDSDWGGAHEPLRNDPVDQELTTRQSPDLKCRAKAEQPPIAAHRKCIANLEGPVKPHIVQQEQV